MIAESGELPSTPSKDKELAKVARMRTSVATLAAAIRAPVKRPVSKETGPRIMLHTILVASAA